MMARGDDGRINIGWRELAGAFVSMLTAASVPVAIAMVVMYGDVREIKSNIKYQGQEIGRLDQRLIRIETEKR
jgi:hypothetical protein